MPKSLIVGLKGLTPIRNTAVRLSGFGRWASKRSRSAPSVTDYLLEITLRCSQRGRTHQSGMRRATQSLSIVTKLSAKEIEDVSFSLYMVGYIIFVAGLAMAAHLLHVPPRWIGVGVICLAGLGILTGVTSTRHRDPPA